MRETTESDDSPRRISMGESFPTWCRVAALSFGGPAGQIAVMHRILVDEKKWISEERFLHALNYCTLLPGPEAQQLATYVGWLMHGARGGLMAGTLFILPGIVSILGLSLMYAVYQETSAVQAMFFGLKAAVLAIVIEAVLRIGKRVLKNRVMVALAATSFVALFVFGVPFPAVVIGAGVIGYVGGRVAPEVFQVIKGHGAGGHVQPVERAILLPPPRPTLRRALLISGICLPLWFGPVLLCYFTFGAESVFPQLGWYFSKAAVVTFGGAYAVLAYVAQQAVSKYHWLVAGEMQVGLSMAETTPGPLIMVVQFVGFMAAFRHPGPFTPVAAGIVGSLLTTWVTFVPCFYWIFLGAPYIEKLRGNRLLSCALSSITAAVVGVILNLAVWFALHTLFETVHEFSDYGLHLSYPEWSSVNWPAVAISGLAMLLTFYWRRGMLTTLAVCAACGMLVTWWRG